MTRWGEISRGAGREVLGVLVAKGGDPREIVAREGLAVVGADGELAGMVEQRYSSWDSGVGAEIEAGKHGFASLEKYMLEKGDVTPAPSGRQELFENVVNRYVF